MLAKAANRTESGKIERRLLFISLWLSILGAILTGLLFDASRGLSFLCGSALAIGSVLWLRDGLNAVMLQDQKAVKQRALAGFLLRLLLIPLCLYAMIRFLFLSAAAAALGFAVTHCSIFVEGLLEALNCGPGSDARTK
jgi:hypothetical protein